MYCECTLDLTLLRNLEEGQSQGSLRFRVVGDDRILISISFMIICRRSGFSGVPRVFLFICNLYQEELYTFAHISKKEI